MRNSKRTKSALITSMISLVLCFTMLLGTTYAWFTDTASTGVNKIQAGNLDVELWMYVGLGAAGADTNGYINISDNTQPIFGTAGLAQNNNAATLWEPGKTQVAYLQIRNNGNLALKYKVAMDVENVTYNMNNALRYTFVNANPGTLSAWTTGNEVALGRQIISTPDAATNPDGVKLAAGDKHNFALSVHMQEDAGNEYKGGNVDFDLTVFAAQLNAESDSFGSDYDKNAEYNTYEEAKKTANAISANVYNQLGTTDTARYFTWAQVQAQVDAVAGVSYYAPYGSYDTNAATPTSLTINGVTYNTNDTAAVSVGNNNFIKDEVFKCENGVIYVASPVALMESPNPDTALAVTGVAFKNGTGTVTKTGDNNYTVKLPNGTTWLGMYYNGAEANDVAITRKVKTVAGVTTVSYGVTSVENATNHPVAVYPVGWDENNPLPAKYNGATMQYTVYIVNKGMMEFNFTYTLD